MREISTKRSVCFLAFLTSICTHFIAGYSDDPATPKSGTIENHAQSGGRKGSTIAVLCILLVGVALLSVFLFKFWQKKRREEQYARLLKLFEEDDELELELGLRD